MSNRRQPTILASRLAVPLVLLAVAGALAVIFGPIVLKSASRVLLWATTEADGGYVTVEIGDRYVEVEFFAPFPSPPIVMVTPQQSIASLAFAPMRVNTRGFRLEVSEPAAVPLLFNWTAAWNLTAEIDDWAERGLPDRIDAVFDGETFEVHIESYRNDRPGSLLVPLDTLAELDAADEDLAGATLEAARVWFNGSFTCSWLDRVRYRVYARAPKCPAWGAGPEWQRWASVDVDEWTFARTARGLEVAPSAAADTGAGSAEAATARWADLVRDAAAVDLFPHNNQVLDFVDATTTAGILAPDARLTIIHFDAHSDLHAYPDPAARPLREDISDFMNRLLADGRLAEVYWVLPQWTTEPNYRHAYWEDPLPVEDSSYVEGPRSLEVFVDVDGLLYFGERPNGTEIVTTALFHKVLLDELPDFTGRQHVYLEIDGDYFSNTGYDTQAQGRVNPSRGEMLADIAKAGEVLAARGVRPHIVSWCLSPSYTSAEDELEQERFFMSVLRRASAADYLLAYAHAQHYGALPQAMTRRRDSPLGQLLFDLRVLDLQRPNGDRRIDLRRELDDSLAALRLHLTEEQNRRLLRRLDRFDGRRDGVIDLVDAEYYAAVADLDALLDEVQ